MIRQSAFQENNKAESKINNILLQKQEITEASEQQSVSSLSILQITGPKTSTFHLFATL